MVTEENLEIVETLANKSIHVVEHIEPIVSNARIVRRKAAATCPVKITMSIHPDNSMSVESNDMSTTENDGSGYSDCSDFEDMQNDTDTFSGSDASPKIRKSKRDDMLRFFRQRFEQSDDEHDDRNRSNSDATLMMKGLKETSDNFLRPLSFHHFTTSLSDKSDMEDDDREETYPLSDYEAAAGKSNKKHKPPSSSKHRRTASDRSWKRRRTKSTSDDAERPRSLASLMNRKLSKVQRQFSMPANSHPEKGFLNLPDKAENRKPSVSYHKYALSALNAIKSPLLRRKSIFKELFDEEKALEESQWQLVEKELESLKETNPDAYSKICFPLENGTLQDVDVKNQFKIIQVQERFPHDKLDLDVSLDEHEKLKHKRHNMSNTRPTHKKGNISADVEIEHRKVGDEDKNGASTSTPSLARRLYIQEGPVKLTSATSSNDRYFFLFNDLLLLAKPKSASTFKLKERVRVSDIWLATCIDLVTEVTVAIERAFVIGWPTANYVAVFKKKELHKTLTSKISSVEEKELWYNAIQKSINERREQEELKEVTIKVCNRANSNDESSALQSASFPVTSKHDAREVIRMSLEQFQCQNEEASDYELWLKSKDMLTPYPLIGHELPYAIKMNHTRNTHDSSHDENENQYETGSVSMKEDGTCQFILRKAKRGGGKTNLDAQKKWKKNPIKKSPIINLNWAMNKNKSVKTPYTPMESLPPGKLFGNALTQLSSDEENIPRAIQDILIQLFRRGPATTGIFRKSANQRVAKQVRQALDQGKEVIFEDKSSVVLATVMKEFCRALPDSLILSELYDSLIATKSVTDVETRTQQVKRILQQLPRENYEMCMKFMCALHHIQRFSQRNNMNAYNLSICVSPSVMWPPANTKLSVTEQASGSSDVICFIIENYLNIFSLENEYILGAETDIEFNDGPGEDSDSGTDQFVYKCSQPSEDEDERKIELDKDETSTPEFIFTTDEPSIMQATFTHSDSSLGTNDSDDIIKTSPIVNSPTISLVPDQIHLSKSSPSSPAINRKKEMMLVDNRTGKSESLSSALALDRHSDWSDQDEQSDQFKRKLLKQQRNKRILSSSTTSAELIEHKVPVIDIQQQQGSSPKIERKKTTSQSSEKSESPTRSSVSKEEVTKCKVAKKSVISQPVIQHFSTEIYQTPNYVFHAVDRRRQPAAPSYEEHIQRTQSKHRIIQSTTVKQPVISHAALVEKQNVDDYQPLRQFVKAVQTPSVKTIQPTMVEVKHTNGEVRTVSPQRNQAVKSVDKQSNHEIRTVSPQRNQVVKSVEKQSNPEIRTVSPQKNQAVKSVEKISSNHNPSKETVKSIEKTSKETVRKSPSNSTKHSVVEVLPSKSQETVKKNDIDATFDSIFETIHINTPVGKSKLNDSISSLTSSSSNTTSSSVETTPPKQTVSAKTPGTSSVETIPPKQNTSAKTALCIPPAGGIHKADLVEPLTTNNVKKVNVLPTAPKPSKLSIKKNNSISSEYSTTSSRTFSESTVSSDVFLSPTTPDKTFTTPLHSPPKSPKNNNSPFTLNVKSENNKTSVTNSEDQNSAMQSSLQLQKTSLTKAPLKLDQLRRNTPLEPGRIVTARELRKTNKRLRSEVKHAFNDGFVYKPRDPAIMDVAENYKNKKITLNGHLREQALLRGERNTNPLKMLTRQNNQENIQRQTQVLLEASKNRYQENRNKFLQDNNNNTDLVHKPETKHLSSEESYV